jgi:hypothetical protein
MTVEERLEELRAMVLLLVERQTVKDFYEIEEFARLVGREPFTCREWARQGRIRAEKKLSGRGAHARWVVPHSELLRYQKEGLLPIEVPAESTRKVPAAEKVNARGSER